MSPEITTPPSPGLVAARARKLHLGHFAFMRAVVQGLDPRDSWERYFRLEGEASDQRLVRSTIAWIRDEFAAAAQRHDRFGTARLLRLDATRIADPALALPSLAQFAQDHGLEDEREADQIAAYEAEYGRANQRQRRRGRLIARQLAALAWLEGLLAQPLQPGDALAAWLQPSLARHLAAADVFTVAQLVERINGLGRTWYSGIGSLGPVKAQRLQAWLAAVASASANADALRIGPHVATPRQALYAHELARVVAPATAIRPLEKFLVPAELDGSQGRYRCAQSLCLISATRDYDAILVWLRSKHGLTPEQKREQRQRRRHRELGVELDRDWLQALSHTQRAYRKEAERFLLWAILARAKPLSSMTTEDCIAYRDFLADPQPSSRWCGPRSRERWSPLWRPFEGPLSPRAQGHALTILKNLYGFLGQKNYLAGNPWAGISVPRSSAPKINPGRSFSQAQWRFIDAQLAQLPRTSANHRLRFGLRLMYATGLRLSELVAARVDDLQWVEYPADADSESPSSGWWLRVVGKGGAQREVPVPRGLVDELGAYLVARGLAARPDDIGNQGAHLLGKASDGAERAPSLAKGLRSDPRKGLAASTFYDQAKAFFADCGRVLRVQGDAQGAERFAKASTHWMRHSHASHAIANGMPIEIAQQTLGHTSLATTTIYVTTEKQRRLKAAEAFWGG